MHGMLVGIVGPTAVGKTAVGIDLALMIGGEIISADSMAVYEGMDIGTAKPTSEEQKAVPFHLIDVVRPDEEFSAAVFRRLTDERIAGIVGRGKMPIFVGGSGMYVKALTGGFNIPQVAPDKELRTRLKEEADHLGGEYLLEQLRAVDPATAGRLHPKDIKRMIRALEVYHATGKPISHFHETAGSAEVAHSVKMFGLTVKRPMLYERIEHRVDDMIEAGLVEEVRRLMDQGYDPELPAMKGLGYKQIAGCLLGEYDLPAAIELLKRDTRRFAKRQLTWFRADPDIRWLDVEGRSASEIAEGIAAMLRTEA